MVFFAAVQSKNVPSEDEDDDESELDDHVNPDEFDMENYKGLQIRTLNPCILYFMIIKKMYKSGNCL